MLSARTANAELPKGTRQGDNICYDFKEYKLLLQIDSDLSYCNSRVIVAEHLANDLKLQVKDLNEIVKLAQENSAILKTENERLFTLWKEENKRRHEAENAPKWGSWMGWIVAGVALTVAGGAVTYAVVHE